MLYINYISIKIKYVKLDTFRLYLWALSKIVGTKSSVFSPFSSLVLGGYQDRTSTPNRKDQKRKKLTQEQEWLQIYYKKGREGKGREGKGERKSIIRTKLLTIWKKHILNAVLLCHLDTIYDYLITLCSQYLWTLFPISVFYN